MVLADLDAMEHGKPAARPRAADLIKALDEAEAAGLIDHWVHAYLWRKSALLADRQSFAELLARLHRHARLANALIRASAEVKPYLRPAQVWRSKGGEPREVLMREIVSMESLLQSAQQHYRTADIGTWQTDAVALLAVASDSSSPVLVRAGKRHELKPGQAVRFNRLDLIEAPRSAKPVVLEHAWLGRITLPAGRVFAVWDLSGCLSEEARAKVKQTVAEALAGKQEAVVQLERSLPLVQELLRQGLVESPAAGGAPGLRLILSLFDDAVLPAVEPGWRLTSEDPVEYELRKLDVRGRGRER
jgi:hypothetical protein